MSLATDPRTIGLSTPHISAVMEITVGKVNGADGAAELLGVNPSTLRNKMKERGISSGRKTWNRPPFGPGVHEMLVDL